MTYQELQAKYEEALSRVKELEKENARLKRVLQEHRIAVDEDVTAPSLFPKEGCRLKRKWNCFEACSKGVKMCLQGDGKVKRMQGISQHV